jgi:hypothetical protein
MDLRFCLGKPHRRPGRKSGVEFSAPGLLLTLVILSGCAGPSAARSPATSTATAPATVAASPTADNRVVCADARLLIGDLPKMDEDWQEGLEAATAKAIAWQADARLTKLRVGCQLFEAGFRWQATFYSEQAQTFYASDTGETEPAEVAPADVPTLPTNEISFGLLRRSLAKSGYEDDDVISASTGIDLRVNSEAIPYGPPTAPQGILIYHVAIEKLGDTTDVFVDGTDGTIYRYTSP